ncbi:hypothetical protein BIW11_08216 [Tropilaelaps mercedesae]|uniref:Uncharacterized protein n=1 Tax=Tropilaelaps mercedesae TaxID=418985 RepID=A0A1V9XQV0_9ACAR|nr:hypothetical protein BIW11_08216 [Tropilaelaps mercedesae]
MHRPTYGFNGDVLENTFIDVENDISD